MGKTRDDNRCELYEKRGSRHTRCSQMAQMGYVIPEGELRICFSHIAYEPAELDEICRQTLKMKPKEEEEEPQ